MIYKLCLDTGMVECVFLTFCECRILFTMQVWKPYARCVSHILKECVVSHTLTNFLVCGTLEFSKIAH